MRLNNVTGCKIIEMYANASNNLGTEKCKKLQDCCR
jgi:hypothetical protein